MAPTQTFLLGAACCGVLTAAAAGQTLFAQRQTTPAPARGATAAIRVEVDRLWPKPLPNHWILGSVTGVAVDSRDHIWIVHRGIDSMTTRTEASLGLTPPGAEDCCAAAPPVLEFDAAGTLVSHWGGPGQGFDWPVSPGGITVDTKGNVWITAAGPPEPLSAAAPATGTGRGGGGRAAGGGAATTGGATTGGAATGGAATGGAATGGAATGGAVAGGAATGGATTGGAATGGAATGGGGGRGQGRGTAPAAPRPEDAHVLKFSPTGQFVLQIGKAGQAGDKNSEASLNRPVDVAVDTAANEIYVADGGTSQRVIVFDATTGSYKRKWSGHGSDFTRLSCIALSNDGQVYVCDRKNNRIQVFKKDGTFVKEAFVAKATGGFGSVWDVSFSTDPRQQSLLVADGMNEKIVVLDRTTLNVTTSFGDGGRAPGTFRAVGGVAMDSKGNIYTAEMYEGKRLQKFVKR